MLSTLPGNYAMFIIVRKLPGYFSFLESALPITTNYSLETIILYLYYNVYEMNSQPENVHNRY